MKGRGYMDVKGREHAACASSSMSISWNAGCCNDRLGDEQEIGICHMV